MGRFVDWMSVSADLKVESEPGESGGGAWMRIGESLHRELNGRAQAPTMVVEGRVNHEIMEDYWPSARADESLLDELMLFTHPVVLGTGRPLFDGDGPPVELDLIEHAVFGDGVTLHRYSVRGAR